MLFGVDFPKTICDWWTKIANCTTKRSLREIFYHQKVEKFAENGLPDIACEDSKKDLCN